MCRGIIRSPSSTPPVLHKAFGLAAFLLAVLGLSAEEVTLPFPSPDGEPVTYISFAPEHHLGVVEEGLLAAGEGWLVGPETLLRVVRASFLGHEYSAQISVRLVSLTGPVRPQAVGWRLGDGPWQGFQELGPWVPVKQLPPGLEEWQTRFQLGYRASLADPPGGYAFRLQFQLDYPQLPEPVRAAFQASWEVVADWQVEGVVVLEVHDPVSLGTVGPGLFHPQLGFGALETSGCPVLVGSNLAQGLVLKVRATSAWFPAEFSPGRAGLLRDFSMRLGSGPFLPLPEAGLEVAEIAPAGLRRFLVSYRYQVDEQDVPGEYGLTLEYTVSAP